MDLDRSALLAEKMVCHCQTLGEDLGRALVQVLLVYIHEYHTGNRTAKKRESYKLPASPFVYEQQLSFMFLHIRQAFRTTEAESGSSMMLSAAVVRVANPGDKNVDPEEQRKLSHLCIM